MPAALQVHQAVMTIWFFLAQTLLRHGNLVSNSSLLSHPTSNHQQILSAPCRGLESPDLLGTRPLHPPSSLRPHNSPLRSPSQDPTVPAAPQVISSLPAHRHTCLLLVNAVSSTRIQSWGGVLCFGHCSQYGCLSVRYLGGTEKYFMD